MPKRGGAIIGDRYYTEHALARMAPDKNPYVKAILEDRMVARARSEGIEPGTKEFGDWLMKGEGKPFRIDTRNIPPSVVEAEIQNPGTTGISVTLNKHGSVVTLLKE